jgi:two-component system chemotaxis sensor kinase CheA
VSFFSEERSSELRELFFETAQELLQALNEEGLELEKRPADAELIRTVRRTVHTLKGDSAACGFRDLSDLAHELEDVLTPDIAAGNSAALAQVVLGAADTFEAMLQACREKRESPDSAALRATIRAVAQGPQPSPTASFAPQFAWNEYECLAITEGAGEKPVFNIGISVDPQCPMRGAALQLVRNVLLEAGSLLVIHPTEATAQPDEIEAAIASEHDEPWLLRKCQIPAVVRQVVVQPLAMAPAAAQTPAQTITVPAVPPAAAAEAAPAVPPATPASRKPVEAAPPEPEPAPSERQATPTHTISENLLRVDADRIDTVLNLVGELIIARSMFSQTIHEFSRRFPKDPLRGRFGDTLAHQAQVLNELQHAVMKIRMVPVEQLFRRFPRVVRDISKMLGKDVTLELRGQDTDLDKSILDALAEPMMHLVRNALDHGMESPAERTAAGKPATGRVRLNAFHQGNQIVIEVSDDGRGINREKLAAKALQAGVVTAAELERMSESEVLELIFEAGVSTAKEITQVSGRGVGLDVVKAVLERMKGSVSVLTTSGEGTTFQLKVPLTLAIIKALMFRAGRRLYAVPLGTVLEITRAQESQIHVVDHREVLQLREQVLTLVRLNRLDKALTEPKNKRLFIIVVAIGGRKFGLVVDRLVGEEELVIKALDNTLISSELVNGASILGDGTVVLILNIAAVVEKLGRIRGGSIEASAGRPSLDTPMGAQA